MKIQDLGDFRPRLLLWSDFESTTTKKLRQNDKICTYWFHSCYHTPLSHRFAKFLRKKRMQRRRDDVFESEAHDLRMTP